jgi:hypothetical protein
MGAVNCRVYSKIAVARFLYTLRKQHQQLKRKYQTISQRTKCNAGTRIYNVRRLLSQEIMPMPTLPNRRAPGAGITDGSPIWSGVRALL